MLALSVVLLWWCGVWSACGVCNAAPAELGELAPFAAARAYDVEGTVLLNEAAATDREVGYKLRAVLHVAPIGSAPPHQHFLRFHLIKPKLYLRGKHRNAEFLPHNSVLDSYSESTFYAHWKSGVIQTAYLDPDDLLDLLNFKKSLLSVFQFQIIDGEYNETDISGECKVLYESVSEKVFRKIKSQCGAEAAAPGARYRRVSRYTLSGALDALHALHAEEVVEPRADRPGLKARSWLELRLQPAAPAAPPAYSSLDDALQALPPGLKPLPLTMTPTQAADWDDYDSLETALRENLAALRGAEAGAGGGADSARAALRLVTALRAAPAHSLRRLLLHDDHHPLLAGLCRALGLAGTRAALAAAADVLQLRAADPLQALARAFLEAFALSDRPQEEAVLEVLKLGEEGRSPAVAESALLAGAAAARACGAAVSDAARDSLAKSLARCKNDESRKVRLIALGNLRRADTAELLLQHATRADATAPVRLAALDALAAAPRAALSLERLERLGDLALDDRAPLEVRAAALDLHVTRLAPAPLPLVRVARALHRAGPHELRRLFWQRLYALADEYASVRDIIPRLDRELLGWNGQAHAGTSSVLVREPGWTMGGWRAALESVQVARAGLLRRGAVVLRAQAESARASAAQGASGADAAYAALEALAGRDALAALDLLSVEVWTRGLEAIAGGGDNDAEPEDTAGGLALAVAGTRMRDISLFNGQAELVGHVWAGTASSPTPALRALVPARAVEGQAPLMLGAVLQYRWRGALALALDAHAQVSLWWRTARCELELRAAAAALEEAALHTAWGRVHAHALQETEPTLRIAADLDFYDKIALCVRASTEEHELRSNVTLWSSAGARRAR
ncbi:hypothetical protein O3G_MSEX006967, partial [Manduca sexta]